LSDSCVGVDSHSRNKNDPMACPLTASTRD